jgi:hypothetical protein
MAESKPIDISNNADLDEPAQAENESPLPMRERAKRLLWSALAFPRSILVASTARAISYLPLPVITAAAIGVIVGATTTWGLSRTTPARATLIPTSGSAAIGVETPRVSVLMNWSIHGSRNGYVYVQGHGDIYRAAPGAPLPDLGPVEQIKRQDGRWVVVTPKGIIVSKRDRRYFERL